MTTPHQQRANRENAQKSTGPRTPEGRARSSANALRHGAHSGRYNAVTAQVLNEDPTEISALIRNVVGGLDPQTDLERAVAQSVADGVIAGNRVRRLEAALLNTCDRTSAERDEIGVSTYEVAFGESLISAIEIIESPDGESVDVDEPHWVQLVHDVLSRADPRPRFPLSLVTPSGETRGPATDDEWREKFRELLTVVFGDVETARLCAEAHIERHRPAAELEARHLDGIEAKRLIGEIERVSLLRERVARTLSHNLKTYRILGEPDDA